MSPEKLQALRRLRLDDGSEHEAANLSPVALERVGRHQTAQRRVKQRAEDFEANYGDAGGRRTMFRPHATVLPDPSMDAFFGLLQARENAAAHSGMNFDVDWGAPNKAIDVPTGRSYNMAAGQVAPGMRGRPAPALARAQGLDPSQRGYFTPDEHKLAVHGLERAFRRR